MFSLLLLGCGEERDINIINQDNQYQVLHKEFGFFKGNTSLTEKVKEVSINQDGHLISARGKSSQDSDFTIFTDWVT